jgi:hypothetical protein
MVRADDATHFKPGQSGKNVWPKGSRSFNRKLSMMWRIAS